MSRFQKDSSLSNNFKKRRGKSKNSTAELSSTAMTGYTQYILSRPFISLPKWKFWDTARKNNRRGRKLMENSIAAGKPGFPSKPNSKPSCADSLGETLIRW
ncbi:hypothetical protein AVEN_147424-1 [Araneus ventricosus]|uniref:Uncharacterized protein n=1 Tax=Araneus ventricosus TaxID=182803 RepID=A0A4Y2DNC4_ARAVE|nr:hypothetical protein AVEN_147424-1 [Araneus ventricosus]